MFFRRVSTNPAAGARPPVCEPLEGRQLLAADLIATGVVGVLPETLISGARGRIPALGVDVNNAGDTPVVSPVVVRLFASADGALDAGDTLIVEQTKKLNIRAGGSKRLPIKVRDIPAGITQGTYRLIAQVDATDAVPESNNANNEVASAGTVSIGPAFVDLAATKVFVRPPINRGKNAPLLLTVVNNGNDTAKGTGVVQVTFTRAGQTTADTTLNVSVKINIKSQKTKQLKGRIAVPLDTLAAGDYTVTATILSTLPFTDANPANNTATIPVTVR